MCASLKPFSTSQGEIFKGKQSLVRAAQSGSEGNAVLFFHSPPSVTHFLLPLHNQFDFSLIVQFVLHGHSAMSVNYITYSMQAIAWSIGAC